MNRPHLPFQASANPVDEKTAFRTHFRILKDAVRDLTKNEPDLNKLEPQLKFAFREFLRGMGYELALGNFDILLQEKNGANKHRKDGTVNWYHEFIPLMVIMTLGYQGKNSNGFEIDSLNPYGGLEALICTHLRHDSKEDFKTLDEIWDEQMGILGSHQNNTRYAGERGLELARKIHTNIDLISQRRLDPSNPKSPKEEISAYMGRMVYDQESNPIVFMCKQADVIHNLATIWCTSKFTPEKKMKICNSRENMYGPRYGFTDIAIGKWKDQKSAIQTLDCFMGLVLYPHFRFLENVDKAYADRRESLMPVGTTRYLKRALGVGLIEAINPLHISLKRIVKAVPPEDTERFERLGPFIQQVIRPAFSGHVNTFPYLFGVNDNSPNPSAKPVAAPR